MIQIITDSTSGISQEEAKALGITVLPINIDFDNEIFYDGIGLTSEEFYQKLGEGNIPATLPPNALEFLERFESAKANEEPLLVITVSSPLSVIYNTANLYKSEVDFDNIEVIDSLTIGYGLRLLVNEAVKNREKMSLAELTAHLNKFKSHIHTYATLDNLDLLVKSDRINCANLPKCMLNIKPIISMHNGGIVFVDKKIGTKNAQDYIINIINKTSLAAHSPICVEYVNDKSKTDYPVQKLSALFSTKTVLTQKIPYLLGAYLGENATVFTFVSK